MKQTKLVSRTPLKKTRVRNRSKKTQILYIERRKIVERMVGGSCEYPGCKNLGTEVHEILTRGRGGSILDETNLALLCHECHRLITDNPVHASEIGLLRSRYEQNTGQEICGT